MPAQPSRRVVLQSLLCSTLLGRHAFAQPGPSRDGWLLIGTHDGQGIFRARWNAGTGAIGAVELACPTPQPTYLTRHPRLPVVYSCNETDAPIGGISAFSLDARTATLQPLATQPTGGASPCFVTVSRAGDVLFAANYGGSLAAFPLDAHGRPAPAAVLFACAGNALCGTGGPVTDRQAGPHLHCATLSPDGRFLLACDLGDDAILIFPVRSGGPHPLGSPVRVPTAAGAGPRHLAFHPNGRLLFCINELNCTVVTYRWHGTAAQASAEPIPGAVANIRPASAAAGAAPGGKASTAAEIAVTRDGRFLYTSTRFADVLTAFRLDATTGHLTELQQLPCGGKTPRFFALDPTERWLLCANQDSNTITVFARNAATGQLTPSGSVPAPNPECLLWL